MYKKLPTAEKLREDGCPAAIALMMYKMYLLVPGAQLNADFKRKEEHVKFFDDLVEQIISARKFSDFEKIGEFLVTGLGIYEDYDEFENSLKGKNYVTGFEKTRDLHDVLGLELPNWGGKEFLKGTYKNARVETGENKDEVIREIMKEEEEAERASLGRAFREMSEEEKEKEEEKKRMRDLVSFKKPENWHRIKKMNRMVDKEQASGTAEEWAQFNLQEIEFVKKYGLKGVRFPYYMGLEIRKKGLLDVADNFDKIASALDMPTEFIGFKKRMPVYYGGAVSGSLGTYTYLTHTLFILEDMGDRATAHEWFHALDFDLSKQTGNISQSGMGGAVSFSEPELISAYGPLADVKSAMENLMDGLKNGLREDGKPVADDEYTKPNGIFWTLILRVYAKEMFEKMPEENRDEAKQRFGSACKKLHTKEWTAQQFQVYMKHEYENALDITKPETRDRLLTDFGSEILILGSLYEKLGKEKDFLDKENTSFMMWFNDKLDSINGRIYYTMPTELIARIGEQYVCNKIGQPLKEHNTPQYALPFERDEIIKRFEAFIDEAKKTLKYEANNEVKVRKGP